MKKLSILLLLLLWSCQLAPIEVNDTPVGDYSTEEASQRKNPFFNDKYKLNKNNFPLSSAGKGEINKFLSEIDLEEIEDLSQISGDKKLDQKKCKIIFKVYKEKNPKSNILGEQCNWNLNSDNTYKNIDPLSIILSELDGHYILLLIDEEGLGAPRLFTYLYNLANGQVTTFERPALGESVPYFHLHRLYFVNVSGYLEFTYDLSTLNAIPIQNPPT